TNKFAEAVFPLPPLLELTGPVVLVKLPKADATTLTEKVQEELTARVAPLKLILFNSPTAEIDPPPQEPLNPVGVASVIPAGSISVTATSVSGTVFPGGFGRVNVKLVEPFCGSSLAPNTLLIEGGATTTILAGDDAPPPPSVEITAPVVLF